MKGALPGVGVMTFFSRRLEEVADFTLGKMLDEKKNKGELLPYLANINVRWGEFDLTDLRQMRFEHHELERFSLKHGDIIMCEGGEPGRCAIWKDQNSNMMIQKALHRIRPKNGLNSQFLYYNFLCMGKINGFDGLFTGSTIKHLPKQQLAKLEIKIPPLGTQENIATILTQYDDLIENNRRRIQLLEESARLLYKEWFVHLRFPGHEHVKVVDGVPEGWTKEPLENLLILQRGFDLPTDKRKEGDFPIYASTGINGTHSKAKVKAPGVVTGRSGSLGTVMYISKDFWPLNTTLWVKEFKKVSPLFATFLLRSMSLEGYNGGAAVPTLNRNDVHKIEVLCPSSKLIRDFDEQVLPLFTQTEKLGDYNKKLGQARDLLLPKLMSGEIVV
ncbi:MAG: restriction endonuclease subunit S [Thiothrix litoralis]|uniref:restriction endonuclease subunit S n=1 Tax=Thiothrix litoralis TaxID=2891210 RepID=UPI003C74BBA2